MGAHGKISCMSIGICVNHVEGEEVARQANEPRMDTARKPPLYPSHPSFASLTSLAPRPCHLPAVENFDWFGWPLVTNHWPLTSWCKSLIFRIIFDISPFFRQDEQDLRKTGHAQGAKNRTLRRFIAPYRTLSQFIFFRKGVRKGRKAASFGFASRQNSANLRP